MSTHNTDQTSIAPSSDRSHDRSRRRRAGIWTRRTDDGSSTGSERPPASDRRSRTDERRSSTRETARRSSAPTYPSATPVGQHLVIDRSEWIPGADPEPHMRYDGQRTYRETYYRCVKCGEERQAKRDFPEECDGDPAAES